MQEDLTSLGQMGSRLANEVQCGQMSLYESDTASACHHKQILFDYSLHNQTSENVQSAKYLGITISDYIDWDQQSASQKTPSQKRPP